MDPKISTTTVRIAAILILATITTAQSQWTDRHLQHMPEEVLSGTAIAVGDVNGDGEDDLVFGHQFHSMRVYRGQGDTFEPGPWQGGANTRGVQSLALADVELDGDLDLFVSTYNPPTAAVFVMRNTGFGEFLADPVFHGALQRVAMLVVEDLDGDGDPDVFTGSKFWANDGNGSFAQAPTPSFISTVEEAVFGDLDGDGDRDLVISTNVRGEELYRRDGPASFTLVPGALPSVTPASPLVAADIDGNGSLDLIAEFGPTVYRNDGTGQFTNVSAQVLPAGAWIGSPVLADLTGNGFPDMVSSEPGGMSLLVNSGIAFAPPLLFSRDARWGVPAFVDAAGTSTPWLAVANSSGVRHGLFAHANGTLVDLAAAPPPAILDPSWPTTTALLVDVNGDGADDIVATAAGHPAPHQVWLQGAAGFDEAPDLRFGDASRQDRIQNAADLDGDGDPDLISGGSPASPGIYINDGNGNFSDETATRLGTVPGYRSYTCDLNGDGAIDLAFEGGATTDCYFNVGGQFVNPIILPVSAVWTFVDLDGDGATELIANNPREIYRNDGTGQFTPIWSLPNGFWDPQLADLDGDGDVDAVSGGFGGNIWINDGTGVFADETAARASGWPRHDEAFVTDVDGDGDPDLVGTRGQDVEWFANDGSGQFTEVTGRAYQPSPGSPEAIGDLDGDGDPDFLVLISPGFYEGEFSKHYNRLRQLEVPLVPRLGGTLDVDVHMNDGGSGPNRIAALFVDLGTSTPIRLVPFGTWHLSLVTALQLDVIPVPADVGSRSYALPAAPGVLGVDLYLQAILVPSPDPWTWRFSNVVRRPLLN